MEKKVIAQQQPGLAPTLAGTVPVAGAAPIGGTKVLQAPVVGAPTVIGTTGPVVSPTPIATTTTVPTDSRMAAAKQTMAMAQGIASGVPPTNEQLTSVISGTENVLHQQATTLNPAGQKAAHDAAVLLQDVRQVIVEKNPDSELQGLMTDFGKLGTTAKATAATAAGATGGTSGAAGAVKDKSAGLRQQLSEPMRNFMTSSKSLMKGLVRNQELRNSFRDLLAAFQWAFFQRSQHSSQWINSNWGGYTNGSWNWAQNTNAFDSYGASTIPSSTLGGTTGVTTTVQQPPVFTAPTGPGFQTIPQQPQRFDNYMPMTEGERIELRNRLLPILIQFGKTPQSREALVNFFTVMSAVKSNIGSTTEIKQKVSSAASSTGATPGVMSMQQQLSQIFKRLRSFAHRFTNGKSIDDFVFFTKEFLTLIRHNHESTALFHEWKEFFIATMNSGYDAPLGVEQTRIQQFDNLIYRTDVLFASFANHYVVYRMMEEASSIINAIRQDPLRQKLANDTKIFVSNFVTYDSYGRPSLNTEVLSQMKSLLVPLLREQLYYLPIPKIEGSNGKYDYWLDNIIFSTDDILPDHVRIEVKQKTHLDRVASSSQNYTRILFTLDNVRTHMRNVRFWYRRNTMPKMTDEGFADVFLTRNGARIRLALIANFNSQEPFTVEGVKVTLDRFKIKVHESKHDWLYNAVTTLFRGRLRRDIEMKAEESIRNAFGTMNQQLGRFALRTSDLSSRTTSAMGQKISAPVAQALHSFVTPASAK